MTFKMAASTSSMDQGEKVWDFVNTELLIDEYEKYPCLYNTKIKEHKDIEKRKAALEKIGAVLNVKVMIA